MTPCALTDEPIGIGKMTIEMSAKSDLLFEHLRDVVFFIRASDGRILAANAAAEALYGWTPGELREKRIYDIIEVSQDQPFPPRDATRDNTITEAGVLFEASHLRRDGGRFPVEVSARLETIDGEPTIIAVVRDITERVEAQRALRRAYDEMEQVFDTAADGMRIVDKDFTVTRMNRTLAEMTGLETDSTLGYKCYETFSGNNCHTEQCPLELVMGGAGPLSMEVEKTNAHGESISCIVHAQPFLIDGEVAGIVESFRDITERKRSEDLARYLATHDALTELPNRLLFTDRLDMEMARARREGTCPTLMFCDVDRFKLINDTLGHSVGDDVLRSVARSMNGSVREIDSVARLGGDEFVVLLSDVKRLKDAEAIARKILGVVKARSSLRDSSLKVTLSIGIAVYRPEDDVDSLMKRADVAMYQVKERGGDDFLIAH